MPHQCTNCGRTFADGSKEMLSGCPDCSGTKFQFRPDGFDDDPDPPDGADDSVSSSFDEGAESASGDAAGSGGDAVSRTVGSAAATVRDFVSGSGGDATTDDDIIVAESDPVAESDAQADARSGFAEPDELPDRGSDDTAAPSSAGPDTTAAAGPDTTAASPDATASAGPDAAADGQSTVADPEGERSVAEEPDAERADEADLDDLRAELNEQFESIRVVEPGQYELNLMELYDREEYIIALQEDGRYTIQVPETWRDADV